MMSFHWNSNHVWCIVLVALQILSQTHGRKKNVTIFLIDREDIAIPVAENAIKSINENEHILPDVELIIFHQASLDTPGNTIRDTLYYLGDVKDVMAMFGPLASGDIPIFNQVAVKRSILQVNYNALQENFSNKRLYPYLFNSCQLYNKYEESLTDILLHYDWKKIGILYQTPDSLDENINYEMADKFERHIRKKGISEITVHSLAFGRNSVDLGFTHSTKEYMDKLDDLQKNDVRIILIFLNRIPLRSLFCEAFQLGMYGPKYMYIIFYSHDFENWFVTNQTRCSDTNLLMVAESAIFLDRKSSAADDVKTVCNETVGEIWGQITKNPMMERRYLYLYDGIWAFALSLHKVLQKEPTFADNVSMVENITRLNILAAEFENVNFQGATGYFNYTKDNRKRHRTEGDIVLRQYQYVPSKNGTSGFGRFLELGTVGSSGTYLNNVSKLRKNGIPLGRPKVLKFIKNYPDLLITIIWILCGCGISLAAIFFLTNIVYRNLKFIKLSSPNINNLICAGCIVLYAAVILYGLDTNTVDIKHIATICNATVLLLCMGFTLTFGALFSKTWRIYRIFTRSQSLRSAVIKDFHLFSIVLVLLLIDLIVFFVWIGVSPYELQEYTLKTIENKTMDTIEKDIYHRCESKHQSIFLSIMFAYKGLLMLFGLFVAYETRSIAVEAINDAKYIGFAVYNVALFITLSSILVYAIYDTDQYQVVYGIFAFGIFEATTVTMFLVFIPKINMIIHEDYEDPNFKNGRPVMYKSAIDYSETYSNRKVSGVL